MWYYFKEPIVQFFGMSREALHIHLGLALFLLSAFVFRRNRRCFLYAWLIVLAVQAVNEMLDFHDWYLWTRQWNWQKSMTDTALTLLWPTVVLVLANWGPWRRDRDPGRASSRNGPS